MLLLAAWLDAGICECAPNLRSVHVLALLSLIFSSQRAAQRAILPSHTSPPEILVNHVNHVNYVNLAKLFEFSKN
jgi:hypothetical protein